MEKQSFTGIVSETGEHPRFSDWLKAVRYGLLCRKGKLVELFLPVTMSRKRTTQQNRYYRGLLGLLEPVGYTGDEWHDMMRSKFLFEIVVIGDEEIKRLLSTTKLDTVQMSEYIEKIREWQREFLPEYYLPMPEEWRKMEEAEDQKILAWMDQK